MRTIGLIVKPQKIKKNNKSEQKEELNIEKKKTQRNKKYNNKEEDNK